jgi:cell division protein FtsW
MSQKRKRRLASGPPDLILFLATLGLLGIGIIMVFSASSVTSFIKYSDSTYFLKRQLAWTVIGVAVMVMVMKIDYRIWRDLSVPILLGAIALLVLVLVAGVADEVYGAKRWIRFGPVGIQPSEIAKFAVVLFLSSYLGVRRRHFNILTLIIPLAVLGTVGILLMEEPDLGTSVITAGVVFIMLFVGGTPLSYLAGLAGLAIPAFLYLALSDPVRRERLMSFRDPWADPLDTGFQIIQSLLALGSGGIFGLGLGKSRQKFFYLPEQHTDFIFAILGEELGFVGCAAVLFLFFLFAWRGYRTAITAPDRFSSLFAAGITSSIFLQMLINVAVVSGSIPITGIALPFISSGGSSLVTTLIGVGILLNISTHCKS